MFENLKKNPTTIQIQNLKFWWQFQACVLNASMLKCSDIFNHREGKHADTHNHTYCV